MRVGVVIPALDEEASLVRGLAPILDAADRVVVSDGGSRDGTVEVARRAGATVVESAPGRGIQLNRGAAELDTDILLFLHADTRLPEGGLDSVRQAIRDGCVGGGFLVRFDSRRRSLALGSRLVNLRSRVGRIPLGDQAQFVRRDVFERLGGFRDWPILEDLEFIRRLAAEGELAILGPPVSTSARRFHQRGVTRTVVTNWAIWALWALGVSPNRLARWYRQIR